MNRQCFQQKQTATWFHFHYQIHHHAISSSSSFLLPVIVVSVDDLAIGLCMTMIIIMMMQMMGLGPPIKHKKKSPFIWYNHLIMSTGTVSRQLLMNGMPQWLASSPELRKSLNCCFVYLFLFKIELNNSSGTLGWGKWIASAPPLASTANFPVVKRHKSRINKDQQHRWYNFHSQSICVLHSINYYYTFKPAKTGLA